MDRLTTWLFEIERQFKEAVLNLRDQQLLANSLDADAAVFATLLSASLRTLAWLEEQRNDITREIGFRFNETNPG